MILSRLTSYRVIQTRTNGSHWYKLYTSNTTLPNSALFAKDFCVL